MLGFTGTWNGNRVTIQGSGMGMPSLSIYANELISSYDVQTLIRIGSCGGMQPHVGIRDRAAVAAAEATGTKTHVGGIYSSDVFYAERPDLDEQMVRHGILGVEMEAAELYTLAARHNRRALAVLTVSDHLQTGEALALRGSREDLWRYG
ncbi:Purine nucleoside phosphorylase DeoD-type [Nymphon striatum]|nr:Purine nucleoside phosphorylase DeoD-type [Nymphon striatum]